MATTINNFIWKMYVYVHLEHVEGINLLLSLFEQKYASIFKFLTIHL